MNFRSSYAVYEVVQAYDLDRRKGAEFFPFDVDVLEVLEHALVLGLLDDLLDRHEQDAVVLAIQGGAELELLEGVGVHSGDHGAPLRILVCLLANLLGAVQLEEELVVAVLGGVQCVHFLLAQDVVVALPDALLEQLGLLFLGTLSLELLRLLLLLHRLEGGVLLLKGLDLGDVVLNQQSLLKRKQVRVDVRMVDHPRCASFELDPVFDALLDGRCNLASAVQVRFDGVLAPVDRGLRELER